MTFKARKIDHSDAYMPDPSPPLMQSMADLMYMTFSANLADILETQLPGLDEISDVYSDVWLEVARSAYLVVALAGGAQIITIK
jgi:hypothetical protein